MNILVGTNVDLISPFPASEIRRVFGWNHCYRTIPDSDDTPQTQEDFTKYAETILAAFPGWGIIDKGHLTNDKHEAPLVGVVFLEPMGPRSGFLHFAAGRRAFKMGLVEEAIARLIPSLFGQAPDLLRLGAYVDEKNTPAKSLFRRLGFRFEGSIGDMAIKNGELRSYAQFGLTRRAFECLQAIDTREIPQADSEPQTLTPSEETFADA